MGRNIIEAIRYSYDFLDASAEFVYQMVKDGPAGDARPDNWLTRYVDRNWASLQLSDKLGFLSFSKSGKGFWRTDRQRELFEDLKTVRNALTHPGIFGIEITEHSADFESPPTSTRKTVHGRMRRRKGGVFAEHPEELGRDDAMKAVEIALRHAARFEELFFSGGSAHFSRINTRTGKAVSAAGLLARMRRRYFDTKWATG